MPSPRRQPATLPRFRETVAEGLYREHRAACPARVDRRPGRRCECPWIVAVPGADTRRTTTRTVYGTKTDALRRRDELRVEQRAAAGRPAAGPAGTLDDLARDYFRLFDGRLAGKTLMIQDEEYRRRILPVLGDLDLAALTREVVEAWLAGLIAAGKSRRMVGEAVKTLRVILKAGVAWQRLAENPAVGLRLPAVGPDDLAIERVLDADQLDRLLIDGCVSLRVETMLRTAAEAGLRKGEIIGLRWPDVDLEGRRLYVRRTIWHERTPDGPRRVVNPTKGRRARKAAISAHAAEALADWFQQSIVQGGGDAAGWVWPGRRGQAMGETAPNTALDRAQRRAGLVDEDGKALVTFHGLRHTCATLLFAADVPLIVISRQLGHANPQITATVYAHLLNDVQLDTAAEAFRRPSRRIGADALEIALDAETG